MSLQEDGIFAPEALAGSRDGWNVGVRARLSVSNVKNEKCTHR